MSQIKYYIFVFLFSLSSLSFAQDLDKNNSELDVEIDALITSAQQTSLQKNYHKSINQLKSALEKATDSNNLEKAGEIYTLLAENYYKSKKNDSAIHYVIHAKTSHINNKNELQLARTYVIEGKINYQRKRYTEALINFDNAETIFVKLKTIPEQSEVSLYYGYIFLETKEYKKATKAFDAAINQSKSNESLKLIEARAKINNGYIEFLDKQYDKAAILINEGIKIANENDGVYTAFEGYDKLSDLHAETGNYELAYRNEVLKQKYNDSLLTLNHLYINEALKQEFITKESDLNEQLINGENENKKVDSPLGQLTTILSVALITILSLLTLSLYKNNNIRLKTNNMLFKKNKELLTEKDKAEIAAKTKSNFLSTVTHELRTPLYAVTGLTNMLLEEDPKPEQIQHLKSLKFSGDYLLTFINDILQINKIEANKVELDPEIFNLKHKIENVISALNNSALENNIFIHFNYEKELPETLIGDQLKLSQILINLIGNAIKFTKDGDIWVTAKSIKHSNKEVTVKIEVRDNGIGISQEKQDNMFESFSQGSIQINRKYGGTGLGLSIVKGLVDVMKGKIYLESELGKGTSFFVEIPLETTDQKVKALSTEFSDNLKELDLSKVNVLVVEDNKINQMITKKILTKIGLNTEIVDNGEDAVDKVKENNYDIVLMDIHMPGIRGIEATKIIRSFDKELTIFALTAVTIEDKMQEFEEAGFTDIISKPFKQEDLTKKLYQALAENKNVTA